MGKGGDVSASIPKRLQDIPLKRSQEKALQGKRDAMSNLRTALQTIFDMRINEMHNAKLMESIKNAVSMGNEMQCNKDQCKDQVDGANNKQYEKCQPELVEDGDGDTLLEDLQPGAGETPERHVKDGKNIAFKNQIQLKFDTKEKEDEMKKNPFKCFTRENYKTVVDGISNQIGVSEYKQQFVKKDDGTKTCLYVHEYDGSLNENEKQGYDLLGNLVLEVKRLAQWPQKHHNKLLYEELIRWVQGESIKSYFLRGDESINNKSPLDGEDFNPEDAELANNAEKYVKKETDRLKGASGNISGEVNHNLKSYCEGYVKLFEKKK